MQQNIGILDRYVRITGGLLIYAGGFQMRRSFSRGALLTLGAMKVAEGISGWCPLLYAMGVQTLEDEVQSTAKPQAKNDATTDATTGEHAQNHSSRPQASQQPRNNEAHRSGSQSKDKLKHEPEQKDQSHDANHNKGQGPDEEILFS